MGGWVGGWVDGWVSGCNFNPVKLDFAEVSFNPTIKAVTRENTNLLFQIAGPVLRMGAAAGGSRLDLGTRRKLELFRLSSRRLSSLSPIPATWRFPIFPQISWG